MEDSTFSDKDLEMMNPEEFRSLVRRGMYKGIIEGVCMGYIQANLVVIPKEFAYDFLLFAIRNPKPCYLLDVTDVGNPCPKRMAPTADLRTDLPRYRVWKNGELIDEPYKITSYWRNDLVSFLLGCSYSFEMAYRAANIKSKYIGVYTTNIQCIPAGSFQGNLLVTGLFVKSSHGAIRAVQISSRHLTAHGAPVHVGDPTQIGTKDIYKPDIFCPTPIARKEPDEIAIFHACGITPQMLTVNCKLPFMISHWPGHMFVTDCLTEELAIL